MANHYLFTGDTSLLLNQVIKDKRTEFGDFSLLTLELDNKRGLIYTFALDAHEVGKYCFPIDIYKTYKRNEFERIIDSQISYFDVFMKHYSKPIIFLEYEKELNAAFDYFRIASSNVESNSNLTELFQEAFFSNIRNISNRFDENTESSDFVIAFKLALNSFGVERLKQIYPHRINFESKYKDDELLTPLNNYKINETAIKAVCEEVKKNISVMTQSSLRRDVISIDKVYFLNNYFISEGLGNRIIYFSSAPRTKYILEAMEKISVNYESNFSEFNPWRTPVQIYLYLMLRKLDEKNRVIAKETIESLETIRDLFIEAETTADNYERIEQINSQIEKLFNKQRNDYIKNIDSVESSQLGKIASLYQLTSSESQRNIQRSIDNYFKNEKEQVYEFLSRMAESEIDIDRLVEQIQTNLKLSDVMPEGGQIEFAETESIITNCYNAFPILLFIENEAYTKILNDLFNYWFDYYKKKQHNNLEDFDKYQILRILEDFISLGTDVTEHSSEYYTVSAMLHLINSNNNNDESAKNYIERLEKFDKIGDNSNLLFIKANVLRRNQLYEETINLCKIHKNKDFRFGFTKALALIGLIRNEKGRFQQFKEEVDTSIHELIFAFEEIGKGIFTPKNDFQAVICSNIVYLSSLYFHFSEENYLSSPLESNHIKIAGEYLQKLKSLKPKEEWDYLFPDYYHTEAFFEYVTTEAYLKSDQSDKQIKYIESENICIYPKESWEERLKYALIDIDKAIKFSTHRNKVIFYEELKEKLAILAKKL